MTRLARAYYVLRSAEQGASAIEYAFLASLIAVVIIISVEALGIETRDMICSPLNALEQAGVDVNADCG